MRGATARYRVHLPYQTESICFLTAASLKFNSLINTVLNASSTSEKSYEHEQDSQAKCHGNLQGNLQTSGFRVAEWGTKYFLLLLGLVSVYPGAPRLLAFQEILLQQACTESLQKLSSGMLPAWHGLNNSARTVHKTTTSHRISLEFRTPALHEADKTPARRESSAVSC